MLSKIYSGRTFKGLNIPQRMWMDFSRLTRDIPQPPVFGKLFLREKGRTPPPNISFFFKCINIYEKEKMKWLERYTPKSRRSYFWFICVWVCTSLYFSNFFQIFYIKMDAISNRCNWRSISLPTLSSHLTLSGCLPVKDGEKERKPLNRLNKAWSTGSGHRGEALWKSDVASDTVDYLRLWLK